MHIAIDFDGTCVVEGADVPHAARILLRLAQAGHSLCLWTCRYPNAVAEAVQWFNSHSIPLRGVNRWNGAGLTPSPKIAADLYIDDCGLGTPLTTFLNHRVVDWQAVEQLLETWNELPPHTT